MGAKSALVTDNANQRCIEHDSGLDALTRPHRFFERVNLLRWTKGNKREGKSPDQIFIYPKVIYRLTLHLRRMKTMSPYTSIRVTNAPTFTKANHPMKSHPIDQVNNEFKRSGRTKNLLRESGARLHCVTSRRNLLRSWMNALAFHGELVLHDEQTFSAISWIGKSEGWSFLFLYINSTLTNANALGVSCSCVTSSERKDNPNVVKTHVINSRTSLICDQNRFYELMQHNRITILYIKIRWWILVT